MPAGWSPGQESKAFGDAKALADKVTEIGKKIQESYDAAKREVEASATAAKTLADETSRNLSALARSVPVAEDLARAYERAAAAARELDSSGSTLRNTPAPKAPSYSGKGRMPTQSEVDKIVEDIRGKNRSPTPSEVEDIVGEIRPGQEVIPGEYQFGGVVPGPIGRAQVAIVHGGETIRPPDLPATGATRAATIIFQVSGREIARATVADLQQLIADRVIRVK